MSAGEGWVPSGLLAVRLGSIAGYWDDERPEEATLRELDRLAETGEPYRFAIVVSDFEYSGPTRVVKLGDGEYEMRPLGRLSKRLAGSRMNPARLPR